jgi:hypothetical protein
VLGKFPHHVFKLRSESQCVVPGYPVLAHIFLKCSFRQGCPFCRIDKLTTRPACSPPPLSR